jgi:hypothetical protein
VASNSDQIVQQVQHEFQGLVAYVTGPEARSQTASTVELTLFRRRLALGATRLRLFFVTRAAIRPAEPVSAPDDTPLTYHDQRPVTYDSVCGKGRFWRHAFTACGQQGLCPLDAELSLPARCYSDLLREWAVYGATEASYRESQTVRERILGLSLSLQALATSSAAAGEDGAAFYEQPAEPPPASTAGTILVVQADGKGVPMLQPPTQKPPVRLGKGQKRTKKKEAVVTGLYTIAPYCRTPQDVVAALLQDSDRREPATRPLPGDKEVRATLEGKEVAVTRLAPRAGQREGAHIQPRVALTDGAEALQEQVQTHLPQHILVLDIIPVAEYLWATANTVLGETHPHRPTWVRASLESLLNGETDAVIAALEVEANDPLCTATQRQVVRRTVGDSRRNRPYMRDDESLAHGWPIGTGVVEGACRHLVQDRMEPSGMRWTKVGAQAMLDLRAVRLNGQWDAYWPFHRQPQHQRLYGTSTPVPERAEGQALELAA